MIAVAATMMITCSISGYAPLETVEAESAREAPVQRTDFPTERGIKIVTAANFDAAV